MSLKKITLLSIPIALLLFVGWFYFAISGLSHDYSPSFDKVPFIHSDSSDSVFIKKKVWGISANHQIIVISKDGLIPFSPDSTKDFMFNGWDPFLYKFENDTLSVFIRSISNEPKNFNSGITIDQKVLSNPEMINLIDNYQEKDLILFNR